MYIPWFKSELFLFSWLFRYFCYCYLYSNVDSIVYEKINLNLYLIRTPSSLAIRSHCWNSNILWLYFNARLHAFCWFFSLSSLVSSFDSLCYWQCLSHKCRCSYIFYRLFIHAHEYHIISSCLIKSWLRLLFSCPSYFHHHIVLT